MIFMKNKTNLYSADVYKCTIVVIILVVVVLGVGLVVGRVLVVVVS